MHNQNSDKMNGKKTKERIPVAVKMEKKTHAHKMRRQTDNKKRNKE